MSFWASTFSGSRTTPRTYLSSLVLRSGMRFWSAAATSASPLGETSSSHSISSCFCRVGVRDDELAFELRDRGGDLFGGDAVAHGPLVLIGRVDEEERVGSV